MEEQDVSSSTQGSESNPVSITESSPTPSDTSITVESSEPREEVKGKTFDEDQMRIISADVKRRAEAKLRAEYETQLKELRQNNQPAQAESSANIAELTEEQLYNKFKQRQQAEQQIVEQEQAVNTFLTKVQAAGMGQKIESSGLGQLPVNHPLIPMLNSLDNVTDVIDDFDANPAKVASLLAVTMLNPMNGFKELQKISQSIKRNKEALAKPKAAEPPPQLKPSSYGLGDGTSSVSDKRKNTLFRF